MKRTIIVIGVSLLSVFDVRSQWTQPTTVTGPIYYNGGNVGIGTTSPGAKLDVGAGQTARGGYTTALIGPGPSVSGQSKPQLEFFAQSASAAANYNGSTLAFLTGGPSWVDAFDIDNSGNVHAAGTVSSAGVATGSAYFFDSQSGAGQDRATMSVNAFYNGSAWSYVNNTLSSWAVQVRTYEDDFVVARGNANSPPTTTFLKVNHLGNVGIGTDPTVKLDVAGDINVSGNINAKYQDVAEWVTAAMPMAPGTVVILNKERPNEVMPSEHAYDTTIAGVVSAQPGLLLGEPGQSKAKIATTGRVKVRVNATAHPVKIGDLLVTSDSPGMAMKSEPLDLGGVKIHRPGTLIGKALEPLGNGEGEILVLLSLQ